MILEEMLSLRPTRPNRIDAVNEFRRSNRFLEGVYPVVGSSRGVGDAMAPAAAGNDAGTVPSRKILKRS